MKTKLLTIAIILFCPFLIMGKPVDLLLNAPETGTQNHYANNSITFASGYTYSPLAGTMIAAIVSPYVNGSVSYNYNIVDPATRTINTSYLVGSTNGSFNVDPMGAATYSIPIDLPPGVNGLSPNLALVYSSVGGSGIAGYGWQISGISAITRTPQTIYNDGQTKGVNLDANDRLGLDGQRLVCTSGTYGGDGSQYHTESEIFTRVTEVGLSGTGPAKFKTETKSGNIFEYGYNTDAVQQLTGFTEVVSWYVNSVSDLYGNKINYTYLSQDGNVYPAIITYGPNRISFYYKERSDSTSSYFKGVKLVQKLLLDKVDVSYNSVVLKTYQLNYNYLSNNYNGQSVLNEIVEYGTGSSQLNSTVFSYQTPNNVALSQTTYNTTDSYVTYNSRMCTGDFNGDGKADFLCLPDASKGAIWTGMKICYGDGNDNFSSTLSLSTVIDITKLDDIQARDINGDGLDDILYEMVTSGTSTFYYMLNKGSSFGSPIAINSQSYNTNTGMDGKSRRKSNKQENDNQLSSADFDGDGINDVFLNAPNGDWRVYSFANSSGQLSSSLILRGNGNISTLSNQVLCGDFNGDGKADIWSIESTGTKIYTFSGTTLSLLYTSTWPTKDHYFNLGDFNGDGKVDMFVYGYTTYDWAEWQVCLSTGTGFKTTYIPAKKTNLKNDYVRLGDFNGDGYTDLMVTSINQSWTGTYFYINKNKGTDFYTESLPGYPIESHNYYLADYNGDGRTDFICTDGLSPWWNGYQVYKSTGNTAPLLEKVANGLNKLTTFAYTKHSQAPASVYQQGTVPAFPVSNFQGPLPVVSSVAIDNGIGGTNTISYAYEGAKIHRQGKGFLGFSKITTTDATTGILSETQSGYDATYYYPQVNTVTKKLSSSGTTIETTTNSWTQIVLDAATKRILPYVQTSTQTNALTGHSTTVTTSSVDSYGNPTQVVKSYGNGVTETTVNNYTNTVSATDWKLGLVYTSFITYAKSGETSVSHILWYYYSTDGIMKPDLIYYNAGTPLEYTKNYDYDSKGNLTQVYTSGTSIGASQTNYTYDTDGIRLLTATDALGHIKTNTYDSYGRLYTETDYLNNTNTYQYDALARQTSVSNSNGSQSGTAYVWTGANKPTLAVYGVIQTGNDGSLSTAWYDKLQRAIRMEKKGFDGQLVLTDSEFNSKGQTYRVSDPYTAGTAVWTETYSYDSYGRTAGITRNTGRNTTYSYSSATVSETTAGKTFSKTYGPDGTLSSATDNGGTINYAYYPDGKAKTITAPGGILTTMQYDDAARNQTQLVDPSAGTISYTYDGLGRIKTQTDARSMLTTYTYLADGRTDNVVTPEGTTTYTYNTNKQLAGISSPNSMNRTYGYDTQGRVTSVSETIAGTAFTTSFTYDTYGRLSTRTHPSGIVETLGYNSSGYMATISAGGVTQYTITGMNKRQQLTGSTYGSGLTASYGFDTYGYPTSTTAGSVQDYRYSFDPVTGNLNSRQNFLRSISETFTYDNLDRLTGVTGPQNLTMTYNANGNISTKSDIGTTAFGYGASSGPYALTGVTSSTAVIPSVSQAITYSSFQSVATIGEGDYNATIIYNSDNQRAKMDVTQSGTNILTRWYAGSSYMKETAGGVTKEYTYLGGDAYHAPVVAVTQGGATTYYYLLRDYLGNITHVYNSSNSTTLEYSFDAWGRRRNPTDWTSDLTSQPELLAGRGFTSHEHLPWFNLVNMNGRLYDPAVGRFISPDPYVQMPDMTQNMNRYTYCLNNPLLYVDFNGYTVFGSFFHWVGENWKPIVTIAATIAVVAVVTVATAGMGTLAAGAIIGASGGFTSGALGTGLNGGNFGQIVGSGFLNAGIGAIGGVIGGAAVGFVSKNVTGFALNSLQIAGKSALGGFVSGGLGGAVGGYTGGFVTGLIMTGDIDKAMEMGNQGALLGFIGGAVLGGYRGFKDARALGNNPWTGQARSNDLTKAFGIDGTLKRISKGESYPHKNDGSVFENRKGFLPDEPEGYYHEYVHPTDGIQHAGLQRIVIGNKGEIYYTPDHYETFIKIY